MARIHFINKERENLHRLPETTEYETGNWAVTAEQAQKLVGGVLHLHRKKTEPSYFGGTVSSFRQVGTADTKSLRFVFRFVPRQDAKDVAWKGSGAAMAWTSGILED
jgi:hypothetical protein